MSLKNATKLEYRLSSSSLKFHYMKVALTTCLHSRTTDPLPKLCKQHFRHTHLIWYSVLYRISKCIWYKYCFHRQ